MSSLSYAVAEQDRKIEHLKLTLDNEIAKRAQLQNDYRNLQTEQKLMSKAQKVVNTKKRRIAVDVFNDQLDDYINADEEGKCQYINERNRKCTKKATKELLQSTFLKHS